MVEEYMREWDELIHELSDKEVALFKWKEIYEVKANEIIEHTDFKELYGANNQKVRDNHVRNELIAYIERRISFLRELVKCKRVLLDVKTR